MDRRTSVNRSKLSGHVDSGSLTNRITYREKVVSRTTTGHDRTGSYVDVVTLRSKKMEEQAREGLIVMKETELQYVYHLHRYRPGLKRDMIAVDEEGVEHTVIGWTDVASRRWVMVKLLRTDQ